MSPAHTPDTKPIAPAAAGVVEIRAQGLGKVFSDKKNTTTAFDGLEFEVLRGEFLAVVGPSGCGKTSLLRTLAGLEKPTHGTLTFAGDGGAQAPNIAMVFQEHGLLPWMSLRRNITFLLEQNRAMERTKLDIIANSYLERVGLAEFGDYLPHAVSGGMRQRVSLARAFAVEPNILLMDEPFIFLDYQTRITLHTLLLTLWEASGKTVVFVTHDIDESVLLADRVMILSAHPGRIRSVIDIALPRPRNPASTRKHMDYQRQVDGVMEVLAAAQA